MNLRLKAVAAAVLAVSSAGTASALNIELWDPTNSFGTAPNGAAALYSFQKAANYWNSVITNNTTVRLEIAFAPLPPNVLGSAGSSGVDVLVTDVYGALAATGNSALDAIAVANLTPLTGLGGLAMRTNANANFSGTINLSKDFTKLDNNDTYNNTVLYANQSVIKALGLKNKSLTPWDNSADARITFSSQFGFDFDPTNGISTGTYDFTGVAMHEIGHALGFVSGADYYDIVSRPGKPIGGTYDEAFMDAYSWGSTLDLFRYGNGVDSDGTLQLQWSTNRTAFFSIDAKTVFNLPDVNQEAAFFSTGRYNGDGQQASHWKDNLGAVDPDTGCVSFNTRSIGLMDPTASSCTGGVLTQNDLAAFDAMGWNMNIDVLGNPHYAESSADAFSRSGLATVVPEPTTWAQMTLGGILLAGALRRRSRKQQ